MANDTEYIVEAYDKDSDVYETFFTTNILDDAKLVAKALAEAVHKDMLVNTFSPNKEPYDWIQILEVSTGHNEVVEIY